MCPLMFLLKRIYMAMNYFPISNGQIHLSVYFWRTNMSAFQMFALQKDKYQISNMSAFRKEKRIYAVVRYLRLSAFQVASTSDFILRSFTLTIDLQEISDTKRKPFFILNLCYWNYKLILCFFSNHCWHFFGKM